ncbi:MAG: cob(I)yrinic acid a,c-diamide adenosyltransferase [Bacteroidales bacterium]|nr:cob(I)yrinic acid a,c-diamide adenosyltransferase [Bacteroidales bacterium]
MKITTKTGDKGQTSIFGGERVDKDNVRIEANGTMDELNSAIGILRSHIKENDERYTLIIEIQKDIMAIMSLIATPSDCSKVDKTEFPLQGLTQLENNTEKMLSELGDDASFFVLPGGNAISAQAQFVRTLTRRAERRIVSLNKQDAVSPSILEYVNRLSDYFFVFALHEAKISEVNLEKFKKLKK